MYFRNRIRFCSLTFTIGVLFGCSKVDLSINDLDFVLGKWESQGSKRLYANCECVKLQDEEINCEVVTYKRADATVYSRIKYRVYKDLFKWKVSEEVFGTRQQYRAFDLDKSKTRVFEVSRKDSLQITFDRTTEEGRREVLVFGLSKQAKLIITDELYVFNFEKTE